MNFRKPYGLLSTPSVRVEAIWLITRLLLYPDYLTIGFMTARQYVQSQKREWLPLCLEVQRAILRPELNTTPLMLFTSISAFETPNILRECGTLGPCLRSCHETIWQSRLRYSRIRDSTFV